MHASHHLLLRKLRFWNTQLLQRRCCCRFNQSCEKFLASLPCDLRNQSVILVEIDSVFLRRRYLNILVGWPSPQNSSNTLWRQIPWSQTSPLSSVTRLLFHPAAVALILLTCLLLGAPLALKEQSQLKRSGSSTPHVHLGFASSGVHLLSFSILYLHVGQIAPCFGRTFLLNNSFFFLPRAPCATNSQLTPFAAAAPTVLSAAAALLPVILTVLWCAPCAVLQLLLGIPRRCPTSYLTLPPVFPQLPRYPALVGRPDDSRSTQSELVMFHRLAPSSPRGLFSSLTAIIRPASCEVGAVRALPSLPLLPPVFVPSVALTSPLIKPFIPRRGVPFRQVPSQMLRS